MAEADVHVHGSERAEPAGPGRGSRHVTAYRGFFPVVFGDKIEVSRAGGILFLAKDEIEIEQGGGQWLIGLRKAELERGGCGVLVAGRAKVKRGLVGVLLAGRADFKDGSRVLLTLPQALAAGLAAGAVISLLGWWSRARRPA